MKTTFNEFLNENMDMKPYDISTWKYLLRENEFTVGKIIKIDSISTGSHLTKKEQSEWDGEMNARQRKYGYKDIKSYSDEPDWYKHLDIRFIVEIENGDTESWHIKTVLPLTSNRFYALGGYKFKNKYEIQIIKNLHKFKR